MPFVPSQNQDFYDLRGTAGVNPGVDVMFDFNQFSSGLTVRIFGALEVGTVTTGARFGLAGAGTSTTQLNKPTGAANWTNNDLSTRRLYLRITAGGGAPTDGSEVLSPVLSNTTTAIFVNPIPGMDTTTRWQLVDLATQADQISPALNVAIRIANCNVPVEIYGVDFTNVNNLDSLIQANDSASLLISGCNINFNTSNPAFNVSRLSNVTIENCYQTNSGDVMVQQCFNVEVTGLCANAGGVVTVEDCLVGSVTKHVSVNAPSRVVGLIRCNYAEGEVNASSGAATPVYIESCNTFDAVGTLLIGATNTGYGLEVARAGNLSLVGCTITGGTGDVLFQGDATTWSQLSDPSYGVVQKYAGSAVGTAGQTKALVRGNYAFEGDVNVGGRFLSFGYMNLAANSTVITLTGTNSIDMSNGSVDGAPPTTEAPRGCLDVINNSATTQAILPDGASIAGAYGYILNHGSQPLPVVPPAGGAIIGATSAPANQIFLFVSTNANGGKTFFTTVLP